MLQSTKPAAANWKLQCQGSSTARRAHGNHYADNRPESGPHVPIGSNQACGLLLFQVRQPRFYRGSTSWNHPRTRTPAHPLHIGDHSIRYLGTEKRPGAITSRFVVVLSVHPIGHEEVAGDRSPGYRGHGGNHAQCRSAQHQVHHQKLNSHSFDRFDSGQK